MSPDDPRHGIYAGCRAHWKDREKLCDACAPVAWRVRKQNALAALSGRSKTVPALGTLRRAQALLALGWTAPEIAKRAGISHTCLRNILEQRTPNCYRTTAEAIAAAYEALCMTAPEGKWRLRQRRFAERRGYRPPLAWDDIETDEAADGGVYKARDIHDVANMDDYDEVVVQRILAGEWRLPCTKAEKREVVRRFNMFDPTALRPGSLRGLSDKPSLSYLSRLTGWKVERYTPRDEGVA